MTIEKLRALIEAQPTKPARVYLSVLALFQIEEECPTIEVQVESGHEVELTAHDITNEDAFEIDRVGIRCDRHLKDDDVIFEGVESHP